VCYVVGLSSLSKVKKFLFFYLSRKGERGCVFAVFFSPVPEKEILDFIAHGSIIQVFTVVLDNLKSLRTLCTKMGIKKGKVSGDF